MPAVISNTSPIQYLYQLGKLDLLPALFSQLLIPEAVLAELEEGRRRDISLPNIAALSWLQVRGVADKTLLPQAIHLGPGEKEVIALALEEPDSLVLLDDLAARRQAQTLNLDISGTLGILLLAKEEGHINTIHPLVDRLQTLQFRLGPETRRLVLKLANESA